MIDHVKTAGDWNNVRRRGQGKFSTFLLLFLFSYLAKGRCCGSNIERTVPALSDKMRRPDKGEVAGHQNCVPSIRLNAAYSSILGYMPNKRLFSMEFLS